GVVDLGHQLGRDPRRGRIVAGQVRVMGPRQASPGGLDLRRRRAGLDPEHDMRVTFRHAASLSAGRPDPARLTGSVAGPSHTEVPFRRRAGVIAALVAAPVALAYRFALIYR